MSLDPPAPDILNVHWEHCTLPEVEDLAQQIFGIAGSAKRLSSERDETFRLSAAGQNFTLKISNPAEDAASLAFQGEVLAHLAKNAPEVPVPRVVPTLEDLPSHSLAVPGGTRVLRLLTYLEGEQLQVATASTTQCRNIGLALGALSLGMAEAAARPPAGKLLWDLTHFLDLVPLLGFVGEERRPLVQRVFDDFATHAAPALGHVRRQVIHNDFNPFNILVDPHKPEDVVGIIDFGDMVFGPLVADLAVAASYHLWSDDWRSKLAAILQGFTALRRIGPDEAAILPALIAARLAMSLTIAEWRATLRPLERDYILRNHNSAWRGLVHLSETPDAELRALIQDSCRGVAR